MPACTPAPAGKHFGLSCGKGLGVISARYFVPETWIPLLEDDIGRVRYGKFITAMMGRIGFRKFMFSFRIVSLEFVTVLGAVMHASDKEWSLSEVCSCIDEGVLTQSSCRGEHIR